MWTKGQVRYGETLTQIFLLRRLARLVIQDSWKPDLPVRVLPSTLVEATELWGGPRGFSVAPGSPARSRCTGFSQQILLSGLLPCLCAPCDLGGSFLLILGLERGRWSRGGCCARSPALGARVSLRQTLFCCIYDTQPPWHLDGVGQHRPGGACWDGQGADGSAGTGAIRERPPCPLVLGQLPWRQREDHGMGIVTACLNPGPRLPTEIGFSSLYFDFSFPCSRITLNI